MQQLVKCTKHGKSGGPTGVVLEMLKAANETGTLWMTDACNAVVRDGKIPEDQSRSWMINGCKGKGDALTCGSYNLMLFKKKLKNHLFQQS